MHAIFTCGKIEKRLDSELLFNTFLCVYNLIDTALFSLLQQKLLKYPRPENPNVAEETIVLEMPTCWYTKGKQKKGTGKRQTWRCQVIYLITLIVHKSLFYC